MYTSVTCVALRTVKHSDSMSILSVYTAQNGRMSLAIPAGKGREAMRLRALIMPLSVFECQADIRPGRDISRIRDVRAVTLPASGNPVTAVQAMFVADLLQGLLREPQQDTVLFAYIADAAKRLSDLAAGGSPARRRSALANFHLAFMLRLTRFMGVEPDWATYRPGAVFDMAGGVFRESPPAHGRYLLSAEAEAAWKLRRMNLDNSGFFRFSRTERNTILDRITAYFHIHFPSLPSLDSTAILRHIFDF